MSINIENCSISEAEISDLISSERPYIIGFQRTERGGSFVHMYALFGAGYCRFGLVHSAARTTQEFINALHNMAINAIQQSGTTPNEEEIRNAPIYTVGGIYAGEDSA